MEKDIDAIFGEIANTNSVNADRLALIEAKLREAPKEQLNDFIAKLVENLQSSSV